MMEETGKWELSLRKMNGKEQGVLTFEARYLTSMSKESYFKIKKLFESREILNVDTIIIDEWDVSFIMKDEPAHS